MNYNINLKELKDIYLISNTALYLVSNFKADSSVEYLADKEPIDNLIEEFESILNWDISEIQQLVYAYAIYIAILLKREDKSDKFLIEQGDIKFEWFPSIRNIYFEKMKPTNTYVLNQKLSSDLLRQKTKLFNSDSELQIIDL